MFLNKDDAVVSRDVARGAYEPFETALFEALVAPGSVCVDVGANIGYYTLLMAQRAGAQGRVYAFEPVPSIYMLLEKNIRANGYGNVRAFPTALSSGEGSVDLYLNSYNGGDNRMYPSEGMQRIQVQTQALDALMEEKVDVVKMDVQGAELQVLKGMRRVLSESHPVIVLEYSPMSIARMGEDPRELLQILAEEGYVFADVDEAEHKLVSATASQLSERYPADEERFTNILCMPKGYALPPALVLY